MCSDAHSITLSKSMPCLKFTHVHCNHCQNISSQVMRALLSHAPFAVNKLPHFYMGTYLLIDATNCWFQCWSTVLISMLVRCVEFNVGPLCWFQCWSAVTVNETSEVTHIFEKKRKHIRCEWSLFVYGSNKQKRSWLTHVIGQIGQWSENW